MLLVGCGLTSHSVIFQLYSDRTVVQFPNLDLLLGTQCDGQLGDFSVPSLPDTGTRMSKDVFILFRSGLLTSVKLHMDSSRLGSTSC